MIDLSTVTETRAQMQKTDAAVGMNKLLLSESLKLIGPLTSSGSFSGGNAEAQFASFLIDAYADVVARKINLVTI